MADYGSYDSGTGDVISAIQRPALDIPTEQARINQNLQFQAQQPVYQGGADDLINNAIAQRQAIEARRYDLSRQLEGANRRQAPSILSQIEGLDRAAHGVMQDAALATQMRMREAAEGRIMAHQNADLAAKAIKIDREHSIDEQGAQLMTGLGRLEALHRNGNINSEQYDAGLLDLGEQFGLGLHHPEAGKMYQHFVGEADRRNQFNLRRTAAEAARVGARYGVDIQLGEDGMPSIEATKAVALQTPKGKSEFLTQMNKELYEKYGNPLGVASLFNPIAPHTSDDNNKTINLPFTNKEGKEGKLKVPMEAFNQMKNDFQDRYFSVFPPAASPDAQPSTVQSAGLQVGTQRTIGGVSAVWDGQGWKRAQ